MNKEVELRDLKQRPEINGQIGVIVDFDTQKNGIKSKQRQEPGWCYPAIFGL